MKRIIVAALIALAFVAPLAAFDFGDYEGIVFDTNWGTMYYVQSGDGDWVWVYQYQENYENRYGIMQGSVSEISGEAHFELTWVEVDGNFEQVGTGGAFFRVYEDWSFAGTWESDSGSGTWSGDPIREMDDDDKADFEWIMSEMGLY